MFSKINEALTRFVARLHGEEGQALAEYGLILAIIAVAAVISLGVLATALSGTLSGIAGSL